MSEVWPPNPIGPTVELVGLLHHCGFDPRQPRIRIHVVERAEQLLLGVQVTGGPIAADADADGARAAALPLRLPHRVQDALANAFE